MHDVVNWRLLENAIIWVGLDYLHRASQDEEDVRLCYDEFTKGLNDKASSLINPQILLNPWAPAREHRSEDASDKETKQDDPGFEMIFITMDAPGSIPMPFGGLGQPKLEVPKH